jgi:hypothetical protein
MVGAMNASPLLKPSARLERGMAAHLPAPGRPASRPDVMPARID